MQFIPMLIALVAPIAKRVLVALGIGIVTYAGYTVVLDAFMQQISSNLGQMPTAALQLITMFGFPDAAGVILGAFATKLSIQTFKRFEIL